MPRSNIFFMGNSINARANGKLLISGEYMVLAGATALALPLKFGQELLVKEYPVPFIRWTSSEPGNVWFGCDVNPADCEIVSTNDASTASGLSKLLKAARTLNPYFPDKKTGSVVEIKANYPVEWGLGSSSTLISLVAHWAGVDPFALFRLVTEGSGYDIACADRREMIFYRWDGTQPEVTETSPGKAIREHAYFVSLGNKQDSRKEVQSFLDNGRFSPADVDTFSCLSKQINKAETAEELTHLVKEHETLLGAILGKEPIAARFKNFPGTVKSLGAWGGDFAMFISGADKKDILKSIHEYGLKHFFTFDEIKATS
jgi:mevalonate kinase